MRVAFNRKRVQIGKVAWARLAVWRALSCFAAADTFFLRLPMTFLTTAGNGLSFQCAFEDLHIHCCRWSPLLLPGADRLFDVAADISLVVIANIADGLLVTFHYHHIGRLRLHQYLDSADPIRSLLGSVAWDDGLR